MTSERITVLKPVYKDAIVNDPDLAAKLAKDLGRSPRTLDRWRQKDKRGLVAPATLSIIRSYLGLSDTEVLTEEIEVKTERKCNNGNGHMQAVAC